MNIHRILLFWIGCIGTRCAAAWFAYAHPEYLKYMGVVAALISLGFLTIYFGKLRQTGLEVSGERIWWDHMRPVHALFYAAFAYFALTSNTHAWMFLAADVVLGALLWILHYSGAT